MGVCKSKNENMENILEKYDKEANSEKMDENIEKRDSFKILEEIEESETEKRTILKRYHKELRAFQGDYFDKEELEYYKTRLKEEKQEIKKCLIKNKINCREDHHLGSGSFGTVTRGYDLNNGLIMAVKKIFIGKDEESQSRAKEIHEEIEILKKLSHPNIVLYYGSETQNDYVKIYLEFVDMGSIASLVQSYGPLIPKTVANFTKQILKGLEYLHSHDVIHRDIKGDNIFVSNEGTIKLGDFGSAKKVDKQSYLKSMIGTVCWMAPEIIQEKPYGRSADIWSLGCTVYEMLKGTPPFVAKNHFLTCKLIHEYKDGDLDWEDVGELEKDFICCCLKNNSFQRYNVKKLLDHPFLNQKVFSSSLDDAQKFLNKEKNTDSHYEEVDQILRDLNKQKDKIINKKRLFDYKK
jgi:serine/threonine protein kinase